jgi:hypothetical protein
VTRDGCETRRGFHASLGRGDPCTQCPELELVERNLPARLFDDDNVHIDLV